MHQALNVLGQEAADMRRADLRWYRTFLGRAIGFYRKPPLPVLQAAWPDAGGIFHWQDDSGDEHRQSQPQLWVPPSKHPRGVWTAEL